MRVYLICIRCAVIWGVPPMRNREEQAPVSPSDRARDIVTCLIARHGLLQAVDIGRCIGAQLGAAVEQQKRLHPKEWPAQSSQTEPKTTLTMPKIVS